MKSHNRPNRPLPGVLPFPLYHGTSTCWRESIVAYGLGGRKPVEELRAVDFFRMAVAHLNSIPNNGQSEEWQHCRRLMASQEVTASGQNFRYGGGVYLTPSRYTALKYATRNPYGSEFLTESHRLYRSIISAEGGSQPSWFDSYPELLSFFQCPGKPLIVRVQVARIRGLSDENGRDPRRNLSCLFDLLAKEEQRLAEEKQNKQRVDALRCEASEWDAAHAALRHPTRTGRSATIQGLPTIDEGRRTLRTSKKILDVLGQQVNFQAKVVYSTSEFEFEEVTLEEIDPGFMDDYR